MCWGGPQVFVLCTLYSPNTYLSTLLNKTRSQTHKLPDEPHPIHIHITTINTHLSSCLSHEFHYFRFSIMPTPCISLKQYPLVGLVPSHLQFSAWLFQCCRPGKLAFHGVSFERAQAMTSTYQDQSSIFALSLSCLSLCLSLPLSFHVSSLRTQHLPCMS